MNYDIWAILAMIKRKGTSMMAGVALGAVMCVLWPQFLDLAQHAVGLIGGAGVAALMSSILMSVKRDEKEEIARVVAKYTPPPVDLDPKDIAILQKASCSK